MSEPRWIGNFGVAVQILLACSLTGCDTQTGMPEAAGPAGRRQSQSAPNGSSASEPAPMAKRPPPVPLLDIHFAATAYPDPRAPSKWGAPKVGDGWGCVAHLDGSHACWAAATRTDAALVAHPVAWLDGKLIVVGPDRLCTRETIGLECWRAPEVLVQETVNATKPITPSWIVPIAPDSDVQFVRDSTPVTRGAHAGCSGGFCWGTASGSAGSPFCEVGPMLLPCALRDESVLRKFQHVEPSWQDTAPIIGDLFACKPVSNQGVFCVGANRDGWFGTAAECPAELRTYWRRAGNLTAAANATCSRSPVLVAAGEFSGQLSSGSVRSIRLVSRSETQARPRCLGAIPTPPKEVTRVAVGLSETPSACGLDDEGRLFCWGAPYSSDPATSLPVPVQLPPAHASVVWDAHGRYHRSCLKRSNCGRIPVRTTGGAAITCGPFTKGKEPVPIEELGGGHGEFCCPAYGDSSVLVTDGQRHVLLDGSWCAGDSSRVCCSLPVRGQLVVASGLFVWRDGGPNRPRGWVLQEPELCEVAPPD